jgi:hypothetical protein
MYACTHEIGRGFFAGVCRSEYRPPTFATHPHPAIREWLYASIVFDHSHRSESLFTALALVPWQEVQSSEIDLFCLLSLGLCRIVDREFRELLFQALR